MDASEVIIIDEIYESKEVTSPTSLNSVMDWLEFRGNNRETPMIISVRGLSEDDFFEFLY